MRATILLLVVFTVLALSMDEASANNGKSAGRQNPGNGGGPGGQNPLPQQALNGMAGSNGNGQADDWFGDVTTPDGDDVTSR